MTVGGLEMNDGSFFYFNKRKTKIMFLILMKKAIGGIIKTISKVYVKDINYEKKQSI